MKDWVIIRILLRLCRGNRTKDLIRLIVKPTNLNLKDFHKEYGIMNWENYEESGKKYLIEKVIKVNFQALSNPVIFDVGANKGDYTLLVNQIIPGAKIYSFEPQKDIYKKLKSNTNEIKNISCYNIGIGANDGTNSIFKKQ